MNPLDNFHVICHSLCNICSIFLLFFYTRRRDGLQSNFCNFCSEAFTTMVEDERFNDVIYDTYVDVDIIMMFIGENTWLWVNGCREGRREKKKRWKSTKKSFAIMDLLRWLPNRTPSTLLYVDSTHVSTYYNTVHKNARLCGIVHKARFRVINFNNVLFMKKFLYCISRST